MVYDIDGNSLTSAYDISGELTQAFDIDGNAVLPFASYSVSTLFNYPQSNMQGFAVYDGKIAQVKENSTLHIIDIETHTKLKEITMDMGHGNSCQFSDVFHAVGDEFPLFYIRNDGVWVYRISGTSSTLIKKYSFSADIIGTYVAGFGIDSANKIFYTASYTQGDYISKTGKLRICTWDMDTETDNGDGTYSMALISSNDVVWFDRFEAVQGCCFHNGYFYVSCGYANNTQQDVVLFDSSLAIVYVIALGAGGEMEGCAWVDDDYMIIGQRVNTYTYSKITFGT